MASDSFIEEVNQLGATRNPFIFIVDFKAKHPIVIPLDQIAKHEIEFVFPSYSQVSSRRMSLVSRPVFKKFPVSFERYQQAFDKVMRHIKEGNSFLVNLTQPTPVSCSLSLAEIFAHSRAPYRLWYQNQFTVFSPETFVKIEQGKIFAYPMKGTINSSIPNASETILSDSKEMSEHVTIVDLIRNDLSHFASQVDVSRFRYLDEIPTQQGKLLQVSSEVSGHLPAQYHQQLGSIIASLLPAGSICGAPKPKTLDIIQEAEGYDRGYYTGVMGIFDGHNLDSAVMIRYIEQQGEQMIYKSGGGITALSDAKKEYQELIDKVYVPLA